MPLIVYVEEEVIFNGRVLFSINVADEDRNLSPGSLFRLSFRLKEAFVNSNIEEEEVLFNIAVEKEMLFILKLAEVFFRIGKLALHRGAMLSVGGSWAHVCGFLADFRVRGRVRPPTT